MLENTQKLIQEWRSLSHEMDTDPSEDRELEIVNQLEEIEDALGEAQVDELLDEY